MDCSRWDLVALVRQLVEHEAGDCQDDACLMSAAKTVLDKLRAQLSTMVGVDGFRTLLARAVSLATVDFPLARSLNSATGSSFVVLSDPLHTLPQSFEDALAQEVVDAAIAVLTRILELLTTLIGDSLTLRMISGVWPGLSLVASTAAENQSL